MINQLETSGAIRDQIWKELSRASRDRHHAWRTPILATTSTDGHVNARTIILRKVSLEDQSFVFYTDSRSEKVAELAQQPHACLAFWSTRLNWQLRIRATMSVQTSGKTVEALWQVVKQSKSAGDFLGQVAPGTIIGGEESPLTQDALLSTRPHFAVLTAHITHIDWLELAGSQHRRALLTKDSWDWVKA